MNRCKDCKYKINGCCENEHLAEDGSFNSDLKEEDSLIYSYDEGGYFQVGDNFGCVHWELRDV